MSVEIKLSRTENDLRDRIALQRLLIKKCLEARLLTNTEPEKMLKIFKRVSEIIDNDKEEHESIRQTYQSGDFDAAASMLFTLVKEEGI